MGLYHACYYKNINFVKYLIKHGAIYSIANFEKILRHSRDFIELIINEALNNDLNEALFIVCKYNNKHYLKMLIEKGATNLNEALTMACRYASYDCIKLLIEQGAMNLNEALLQTCKSNNEYSARILIDGGATNLNEALLEICRYAGGQFAKLLIERGATNLNLALLVVCESGQRSGTVNCMKILIEKGATDLNSALAKICEKQDFHCIGLLINEGAININEILKLDNLHNRTKIINAIFNINNLTNPESIVGFLDYLDEQIENKCIDFFSIREKLLLLYQNTKPISKWFINEQLLRYVIKYDFGIDIFHIDGLNINIVINLLLCNSVIHFDNKYFCIKDAMILFFYNLFCSKPIKYFASAISTSNASYLTKTEAAKLHLILHSQSKKQLNTNITQSNKIELLEDYLNNRLWKPDRHKLFPSEVKNNIEIFLLSIKKFSTNILHLRVPKPLLWIMINYFIVKNN